jgi:cytosine/adenosine deaminase-related metal-dependent hydrolase
MTLQNVHTIDNVRPVDIFISEGRIGTIIQQQISEKKKGEASLIFENAIAFPGLINSHDHLEFNLFPRLANGPYKNYMEWGTDIHQHHKELIKGILKIPKQLRTEWGIYKNLLNGVTTVAQHGEHVDIKDPLIEVFSDCYSLHSIGLEKYWQSTLNKPFAKHQPFVIHIGEGTDTAAFEEINKLIKWNLFKRKLIAVHGVAMKAEQARSFDALVWCPDSNFFLLGSTAKVGELKKETKILFGTDSTLSANWNMWEQIRVARKTNMLSDQELFDALTVLPASTWGLSNKGSLMPGKNADIVVAKKKFEDGFSDNFFSLNPEDILLVLKNGEIILFDEVLLSQINQGESGGEFSKVFIANASKYVRGNLPALIKRIKSYTTEINFPIETE